MLSIHSSRDGHRHTLSLTGELDIASAPALEAKVRQLFSEGAREIVLDLGRLEFIDSSGLNSILRVRALCEEHMCDFALTPGERPIQRLFEVTRLIDRLPFRKPRQAREPDRHADEGADPSPATPSESDT